MQSSPSARAVVIKSMVALARSSAIVSGITELVLPRLLAGDRQTRGLDADVVLMAVRTRAMAPLISKDVASGPGHQRCSAYLSLSRMMSMSLRPDWCAVHGHALAGMEIIQPGANPAAVTPSATVRIRTARCHSRRSARAVVRAASGRRARSRPGRRVPSDVQT
jgi:hypothetical protein